MLVALSLWLAARPHRTRGRAPPRGSGCASRGASARRRFYTGALRVTFVDRRQGDAAIVELLAAACGPSTRAAARPRRISPARAHRAARSAACSPRTAAIASTSPSSRTRTPDHYLACSPSPSASCGPSPATRPTTDAPRRRRSRRPRPRSPRAARARRASALGAHDLGDGVELVVWAPRLGDPPAAAVDPVRTVNDNSLVVELRYRGRAILFAGDVEAEGEEALVAAGVARVDVVKVAHHGSPTSSTAAFVDATRPAAAVISCGRDNRFRFPSPAVVARWRAAGARVLRTDLDASVTVTIDAAGVLAIE
ncbi:MAG: hypothetical protein KIT31_38555 [Deltaproteobacteria bacterium]|nr:hypothetical protein [Deltaproteobacteria bacterium]